MSDLKQDMEAYKANVAKENAKYGESGLGTAPEIDLPQGVSEVLYDGPTWFLNLPDGRQLRLVEPFEGEFTIERCDVGEDDG